MAVIDELGITVTVNTSDGPLPEFDDPGAGSEIPAENNPTRFCHKYVESVGGAEFYLQIVVRQGPRTSYLRGGANDVNRLLGFYLDIDGKRVSSRMSSASALDQGELNCKIEGRRENNDSGGATLRKYMFAPINTGTPSVPWLMCLAANHGQSMTKTRNGFTKTRSFLRI